MTLASEKRFLESVLRLGGEGIIGPLLGTECLNVMHQLYGRVSASDGNHPCHLQTFEGKRAAGGDEIGIIRSGPLLKLVESALGCDIVIIV